MAIFRKIHTEFWEDTFIQDLDIKTKYLFLYLLTNTHTTALGVYEISKKTIRFETDLSNEEINSSLDLLEKSNKIKYSEVTKEICIVNWFKYNKNSSPKIMKVIIDEIDNIKNKELIQYLYSIDTVLIQYQCYINTKTKTKTKTNTKSETKTKNELHTQYFSNDEINNLKLEYGETLANKYIDKVVYQIEEKEKVYKSPYKVCKRWLEDDGHQAIDLNKKAENEKKAAAAAAAEKKAVNEKIKNIDDHYKNMSEEEKNKLKKSMPDIYDVIFSAVEMPGGTK
jgi:hypothetical protein